MDILFLASAAAQAAGTVNPLADMWAHIVTDFSNLGSMSALSALLQVLIIDVTLAAMPLSSARLRPVCRRISAARSS